MAFKSVCLLISGLILVTTCIPITSAKDCVGASNGATGSTLRVLLQSVRGTRASILALMRSNYANCTRIMENLIINQLHDGDDTSFLNTIEEVYGYVDVYNNSAEKITIPNLRVVRGQRLILPRVLASARWALSISANKNLKSFSVPSLREISKGGVTIDNSANLCVSRTAWLDILSGRDDLNANSSGAATCTCDTSCTSGVCFGPDAGDCFQSTYTGCKALGCSGRCNQTTGVVPFCCDDQCQGGCFGYGSRHCTACKELRNVHDDGTVECVASCPPLTVFDHSTFVEMANPDGRYRHNFDCVKNCSDFYYVSYGGHCVKTCPSHTQLEAGGVCQPCGEICKRTCPGTDSFDSGVLTPAILRNNITNCSTIAGNLKLTLGSFDQHNFSSAYNESNPSHEFDALLSVREITGCLFVINFPLHSLHFLRNLVSVGTCQFFSEAYGLAVYGADSKIKYLGLSSFRQSTGQVAIQNTICYVETFQNSTAAPKFTYLRSLKVAAANCSADRCSPLCSDGGCLGPGDDNCHTCRYAEFDSTCYTACTDPTLAARHTQKLFLNQTTRECHVCNTACGPYNCTGTTHHDCENCPAVRLGKTCLTTCPQGTYLNSATSECLFCDPICSAVVNGSTFCSGPGRYYGPGGCSLCVKALESADGRLGQCVNECPPNTLVVTHGAGVISSVEVCVKCHELCVNGCRGSLSIQCNGCKGLWRMVGSQRECVLACNPSSEYLSGSECKPCHTQCAGGCSSSTATTCSRCKSYYKPLSSSAVECVSSCPNFYVASVTGAGRCVDQCSDGYVENGQCMRCHAQCQGGCTGSRADQCQKCRTAYQSLAAGGVECLRSCPAQYITHSATGLQECVSGCADGYLDKTGKECKPCDDKCRGGCSAPGPDSCRFCRYAYTKLATGRFRCLLDCPALHIERHGGLRQCVAECRNSYVNNSECFPCDAECSGGCSGVGPTKCINCHTAFSLVGGVKTCMSSCSARYISHSDGLRQCVSACPTNMYPAAPYGECMPCNEQCASGCVDNGTTLTSCSGQCKNFAQEGKCVTQCGLGFKAEIGDTVCEAFNATSASSTDASAGSIIAGVVIGLLGICLVVVAAIMAQRSRKEQVPTTPVFLVNRLLDQAVTMRELSGSTSGVSACQLDGQRLRQINDSGLAVGKQLGQGTFGTVCEGICSADLYGESARVAISTINCEAPFRTTQLIMADTVALASVSSPHIVQLMGLCLTDKVQLVYELMSLGTLLAHVQQHKTSLNGEMLLSYCKQVAEGMTELSQHGIVHGNLCARNIMMSERNRVKIADVGVTYVLGSVNPESLQLCNDRGFQWLAPECYQELIVSQPADVWSFGVTLWEILTFGSIPYQGHSATDVHHLINRGQRLPQPSIASNGLYGVLLSCWASFAAKRPPFSRLTSCLSEMKANSSMYAGTPASTTDSPGNHYITVENTTTDNNTNTTADYTTIEQENQLERQPERQRTTNNYSMLDPDLVSMEQSNQQPSGEPEGESYMLPSDMGSAPVLPMKLYSLGDPLPRSQEDGALEQGAAATLYESIPAIIRNEDGEERSMLHRQGTTRVTLDLGNVGYEEFSTSPTGHDFDILSSAPLAPRPEQRTENAYEWS